MQRSLRTSTLFAAAQRVSCLIAAALALIVTPAAARPLRVLTYNIHHGEGRDGQYGLERIASVINAFDPDLVALQEVEQGTTRYPQRDMQLDKLAQLTGMQGYFGKTLNRLSGEYGNGVLLGPEFSVVQWFNRTMPNPADGELRKVREMHLRFDDEGTTRQFDFFATHMDHTSGTNRQAQVAFINGLVADSNTPAILAGDFNFNDEGPAYAALVGQWTDPTAPSPGRPNQIDYVVYRGADQWSVAAQGRFIVNSTTDVASDHYPLRAALELAPYPADFDADGDVDGADFQLWQRNLGRTGVGLAGDANRDHVVNGADRTLWSAQFGGAAPAALPVPEPTAGALAALAAVASAAYARRGRRLL
jgi:endonuclease/exonuclease/phosphatase family metal-dependent hydrolase